LRQRQREQVGISHFFSSFLNAEPRGQFLGRCGNTGILNTTLNNYLQEKVDYGILTSFSLTKKNS
jgi:hypothetical protein